MLNFLRVLNVLDVLCVLNALKDDDDASSRPMMRPGAHIAHYAH